MISNGDFEEDWRFHPAVLLHVAPAAHLCRGTTCAAPAHNASELREAYESLLAQR